MTFPKTPQPRPGVMEAPLYVGGGHTVEGTAEPIVLSANENPFGPSPRAIAAFEETARNLHRYPDGGSDALRNAIAARFGCDAEGIVCGAGSDELIQLLMRAYAGPGDEVIHSRHGFLMYSIAATAAGAQPVAAPETDLNADVDALLDCVSPRTKLVFLANPNNPTGTYLSREALVRLRAGLPDHVLLVVDAAYAEYVSRNDYSDGSDLVEAFPNVVMTRTFSKIFGLAALRLGWCYCPPAIAEALNRVRGPFNVSLPAQAAGIAAVNDIAHTDAGRAHNDIWLPWLRARLEGMGLETTPSAGNFVLVRFATEDAAQRAQAFLLARGIIVRGMASYGLPDALRITVGLDRELEAATAALADFVAA